MKLFRRMSAFTMALALLLSLSISVWAVNYDAANVDDLWTAFGDTSGEDVNVNITTDIDAEYWSFTTNEGINYTVGSENGSTVSNIGFGGEGSVDVNTDVNGYIYTYEDADVTVNGDIAGGASANGESTLTVEGSVTPGEDGYGYVNAGEDSELTVNGDVEGSADAYGNGSVTVGGNVDGSAYTSEEGNVTVNGDVNGGVSTYEGGDITVTGDVNGSVYAYGDGSVTVGGDVNGQDNTYTDPETESSYGETGVYAEGGATVTVGGDVNGGDGAGTYGNAGSGVIAWDSSDVTVDGNVTGGSVTADPSVEAEGNYISAGGSGVQMDSSSTVTVGGNVTGGDTNGDNGVAGNGSVVIYTPGAEAGSLTVGGDVTSGEGELGGSDMILVKEDPEAEYEEPSIEVGSVETVDGYGFTEEEMEVIKEELGADTKKAEPDNFWKNVVKQIRAAQPGDEITVNTYGRLSISASVFAAVRECGVTLVIQWYGDEDLVITKDFTEEITEPILLKDLAELLKK